MPKKQENKIQNTLRQPIVAVMGHVDHGKTTFLDAIRGTRVAEKEHGGITQNTRVHEVTTKDGFRVTFIDTPGHEAFSAMRERGARVTDFVALIVAADDGVQPQTKESIEFAHKHNVPIIVVINKVDLPGINTQKIKIELSSYGVQVEEYGGDVLSFEVSAKNKTGLNEVLEGIQLMTELHELKPHEPKQGVIGEAFVLESNLQKSLGHAAVCILKSGTLDQRYIGFTEDSEFNVRAYLDESGKPLKEVRESQPFTVTGLEKDLKTGEIINFVADKIVVKDIQSKLKTGEISEDTSAPAENLDASALFAQMLLGRAEKKEGVEQKALNIIIRTSTQGTLEAVKSQLSDLETEDSKVNILSSATGSVTEDDIMRAKVARAIIVTFQTPTSSNLQAIAKREKVLIRDYEVIYDIVDEIADVLDSLEEPKEEEVEVARAKVKQIFVLSDKSIVAGCEVIKGNFVKGYRVKAERNSKELEASRVKIKQLRQGKNEVKEVKKGSDCGMLFDPTINDLQEGDEIVAYKIERN